MLYQTNQNENKSHDIHKIRYSIYFTTKKNSLSVAVQNALPNED